MIVRIRNANLIRSPFVNIMRTNLTLNIVKVLQQEGFIDIRFQINEDNSNDLLISLKYKSIKGDPYITNMKRVSTCGQRVYSKSKNVPRVLGGMGVAIFLHKFFFQISYFYFEHFVGIYLLFL